MTGCLNVGLPGVCLAAPCEYRSTRSTWSGVLAGSADAGDHSNHSDVNVGVPDWSVVMSGENWSGLSTCGRRIINEASAAAGGK
jgi:hypothetical protein